MAKTYLLFIAIGLVPVALSYGANPASVLPRLLKFDVEAPNETQVFRAVMCLYIATSAFWLMGALIPEWHQAALIWAVYLHAVTGGRPGAQHGARRHAGGALLNCISWWSLAPAPRHLAALRSSRARTRAGL